MNNFFQFEWINSLNEYFWFHFELNIELNGFQALFNVWMNNRNLSPTPTVMPDITSLYILLSLSHFYSTLPLSLKDDAPQPRSSCTPGTKVSLWSMLSQADVFSFMPNDADTCLWCWLMFNDAYWCWLMLNYVYWCWFVLIACTHFALCAKLSINWKIV